MKNRYATFEEFYPFYLGEHANLKNRLLHVTATSVVILWVSGCLLLGKWSWLWLTPFIGYGLAWIGHIFVERNRPATFRYPLWSLRADFRLFFDVLRTRRLDFDRRDAAKNLRES